MLSKLKPGKKFKQKILFFLIFLIIALLTYRINLFNIKGSKCHFSAWSFIGAFPPSFTGPFMGTVTIFLIQLYYRWGHHLSLFSILRFFIFPITSLYLFGFQNKTLKSFIFIIPLLAFIIYNLHPNHSLIYSMIWLIPILSPFLSESRFVKMLSTTLTAHAIGSTMFIYLFPTTRNFWISLIPHVIIERAVLALGMLVFFTMFATLFDLLSMETMFRTDSVLPAVKKIIFYTKLV